MESMKPDAMIIVDFFKSVAKWAVCTFAAVCLCTLLYMVIFYAVHNAVHCDAHDHWSAEETEYTTF